MSILEVNATIVEHWMTEPRNNRQFIDVRELEEYAERHIPHVQHIPLSEFEERYKEIDPRREAVLICRSGGRSSRACDYLQQQGYTQLVNMKGGMLAWVGPTESEVD